MVLSVEESKQIAIHFASLEDNVKAVSPHRNEFLAVIKAFSNGVYLPLWFETLYTHEFRRIGKVIADASGEDIQLPVADDVIESSSRPIVYLNETCRRVFEICLSIQFLTPHLADIKQILGNFWKTYSEPRIAEEVLNTIERFCVITMGRYVRKILCYMNVKLDWFDFHFDFTSQPSRELLKTGVKRRKNLRWAGVQEREVPALTSTGLVLPKCTKNPNDEGFTFHCDLCSFGTNCNIQFLNVHFYFEHVRKEKSNADLESAHQARFTILAEKLTKLADRLNQIEPFFEELKRYNGLNFWYLEMLYSYDINSLAKMARAKAGIQSEENPMLPLSSARKVAEHLFDIQHNIIQIETCFFELHLIIQSTSDHHKQLCETIFTNFNYMSNYDNRFVDLGTFFLQSNGICVEQFKMKNGCVIDKEGLEQAKDNGFQIVCTKCAFKCITVTSFNLHFYFKHADWDNDQKPLPIEDFAIVDDIFESSFEII